MVFPSNSISAFTYGAIIGALGITAGFGSSSLAGFQYSQFCEQRADNNVRNNIHLLKAEKRYQKRHFKMNKEFYNMSPIKRIVQTHPHPEVRIQQITKRIKAIKETGNPTALKNPFDEKEQEIKQS